MPVVVREFGNMTSQVSSGSLGIITLLLTCIHLRDAEDSHATTNSSQPLYRMSEESRLMQELMGRYRQYNPDHARPVMNASHPVCVQFGIGLIQLLDFNERDQMITLLTWKKYAWKDEYLTWKPEDYGGVVNVFLTPDKIWTPDIILYNNAGGVDKEEHKAQMVVRYDGSITWIPVARYQSSCPVNMRDFPFDEQVCTLAFGSWVYSVEEMDMKFSEGVLGFDLSNYLNNSEWRIEENSAEKIVKNYSCCPGFYSKLMFKMRLKRQVTLHIQLIMVPTVLLSVLSCFVFWIPPNRPDRTSVGLSLFSAFFLLLISVLNNSPAVPEAKLGQYYVIVILLVALAIMISVGMINIYQLERKTPPCVDKLLALFPCCMRARFGVQQIPVETQAQVEVGHDKPLVTALARTCVPSTRCTLQDKYKWQMFTFIIDRFFFIIFVFAIIISFVAIFPCPKSVFEM